MLVPLHPRLSRPWGLGEVLQAHGPLYVDLLDPCLAVFALAVKCKIDALAEGIFSMLLVILVGVLVGIMRASIIGACAGLLAMMSNMSIFLAAKALLYLLLAVIPRDLVVLAA